MPIFDHLLVWNDPRQLGGPQNMAIDEALLQSRPAAPVLRIYEWAGDWISFGFSQRIAGISAAAGDGVSLIRRWTGGGLVDHRIGRTYTLIIPPSHPLALRPAQASYLAIHEALADALGELEVRAELADVCLTTVPGQCFASAGGHERYDVLAGGRKIAGAAQRRGKLGLLHQGNVQLKPWPESEPGLFERFAAHLASQPEAFEPAPDFDEEARELAAGRYAKLEWLAKR